MKLLRSGDMKNHAVRRVFRRARLTPWALLIVTLGTTAVMALAAWEEYGWPMLALVAGAGLLASGAFVKGILSVHSRHNWLLKDCGDLLLINLGFGQPGLIKPEDIWDVALVTREEISTFSISGHEYTTGLNAPLPEDQPAPANFRFLDIQLKHDRTGELLAAIAERQRQTRGLPATVVVPTPGLIRLHWESPLGAISPRLDSALKALTTPRTTISHE